MKIIHVKPSIAVIGSGLAGGVLTLGLSRFANVTLIERGRRACAPVPPNCTGHPLGLHQTFAYGLGGSTNLWRGCLLSMRPDEFGTEWPGQIREQLPTFSKQVVQHLYGTAVSQEWEIRERAITHNQDVLDSLFAPKRPSRIAQLNGLRSAKVRLDSLVEHIRETSDGVELTVCANGLSSTLEFDYVVIAAGSINSPLVLKKSGLGGAQVGLNLTDHPMGMVGKVTRGRPFGSYDAMAAKGPWKKVAKFRDDQTGLWTSFQLCPAHDLLFERDEYLAASRQKNLSILSFARWKKLRASEYRTMIGRKILGSPELGSFAFVLAMTEQESRGQGMISELIADEVRLDWQVSGPACDAVRRSLLQFEQWLECDVLPAPGEIRNTLSSGAHHAGTCRISADACSGVVDEDQRVHGASRVFVCDGSVLPSTGASNPGLTIGSLALRLAAHLERSG